MLKIDIQHFGGRGSSMGGKSVPSVSQLSQFMKTGKIDLNAPKPKPRVKVTSADVQAVRNAGAAEASASAETTRTPVLSKNNVTELTKNFTPEMFFGGGGFNGLNTDNKIKDAALLNSPDTIKLGGREFDRMGEPYVISSGKSSYTYFEYQSREQIGDEYPIFRVSFKVDTTRKGTTIRLANDERDGQNRTKFY